jgi:hypothetical protein
VNIRWLRREANCHPVLTFGEVVHIPKEVVARKADRSSRPPIKDAAYDSMSRAEGKHADEAEMIDDESVVEAAETKEDDPAVEVEAVETTVYFK